MTEDINQTMMFKVEKEPINEAQSILNQVYLALKEKVIIL